MNRCHFTALAVLATASSSWLSAASGADAPSFSPPPGVEVREEGPRKLKYYKIPNIPKAAEAYYASDNLHIIAQVQDPDAVRKKPTDGGALTWTFTDQGTDLVRINAIGNDACSYFFPDMKHVAWTSVKDHLDLPLGNWSDPRDYPQGGELYMSDLKGGNVRRLTNTPYYDAEISVSPDGKWIVFGRQVDGNMDLWRMKADGTGEQQITFTKDWDEGRPMYLPDSETVMFRAWKYADYGKIRPTPMTVFTIRHDGTGLTARTPPDTGMNWSSYPAPDGRHFIAVRVIENNNWEIFLFDMEKPDAEPERLTYNDSFDGLDSISPDGKKLLFARALGEGFMSDLYTHVMDISSLNIGPENYKGKR
jgi:dipeptidyl aminopeptidase/acylaminoacyl peptidase